MPPQRVAHGVQVRKVRTLVDVVTVVRAAPAAAAWGFFYTPSTDTSTGKPGTPGGASGWLTPRRLCVPVLYQVPPPQYPRTRYWVLQQGAPTHHFARTESRHTASVPPYPVLQEAPTHHFARTESRCTALVPSYAVLQRAPTHRCAQTEVTEPNSPARAALRRQVTTETMCKNSRQLPAGCSALQ